MQNPIQALQAHMDAKPYYTLAHDMDSLYSVQLTAYGADQEEAWQATLTPTEARELVADSARNFGAEGEVLSDIEFGDLLDRLDRDYAEMQREEQPAPPCTMRLGELLSIIVMGTQTAPFIDVTVNGATWRVSA